MFITYIVIQILMEINSVLLNPIEIANIIFLNEPKEECSIQLCDVEDIYMLFEILITILMEGLEKLNCFDEIDDINNDVLLDFTVRIRKWFNSFGFTVEINKKIKIVDVSDVQNDDYYCKIITKNGNYGQLFTIKNIEKNYSFLLNQKHKIKNNIQNIHAIYVAPKYNLEIKFKHHIPKLTKINYVL